MLHVIEEVSESGLERFFFTEETSFFGLAPLVTVKRLLALLRSTPVPDLAEDISLQSVQLYDEAARLLI